tara:strand:+ start:223 stop:465 length:243 start_codon:yes stop_codon:yes gene_type:complete
MAAIKGQHFWLVLVKEVLEAACIKAVPSSVANGPIFVGPQVFDVEVSGYGQLGGRREREQDNVVCGPEESTYGHLSGQMA